MSRRILLILLLSLATAGLLAQAETDSLYFRPLEANEYTLDMMYSAELNRLMVQLDFSLPRASLDPGAHYGVFLHREAILQSLMVADSYSTHYLVDSLLAVHFVPPLSKPELVAPDSPAAWFGVTLPEFNTLPATVKIRLWYYIPVPPFSAEPGLISRTSIAAESFWYPRNLSRDCKVNLKLTTVPYMTLRVGELLVVYADNPNGYARLHEMSFTDRAAQPYSLYLIKD